MPAKATVDGRNPAPVDEWFIPLFMGLQPSKVVQDFFHQAISNLEIHENPLAEADYKFSAALQNGNVPMFPISRDAV